MNIIKRIADCGRAAVGFIDRLFKPVVAFVNRHAKPIVCGAMLVGAVFTAHATQTPDNPQGDGTFAASTNYVAASAMAGGIGQGGTQSFYAVLPAGLVIGFGLMAWKNFKKVGK